VGDADLEIMVDEDGDVQFIYDDRLAGLFAEDGDVRTARASHVEPWGSGWAADMNPVGGPVLLESGELHGRNPRDVSDDPAVVPFKTRGEALAAEVAWLRAAMAQRSLQAR
jgi:hypothetical protein